MTTQPIDPKEAVRLAINSIIDDPTSWNQTSWHNTTERQIPLDVFEAADLSDKELIACVRSHTCKTTHCMFGWIQMHSGTIPVKDILANEPAANHEIVKYLQAVENRVRWVWQIETPFHLLYQWAIAYINGRFISREEAQDTHDKSIDLRSSDSPSEYPHL